jgi:SEC-C motif-containing protein
LKTAPTIGKNIIPKNPLPILLDIRYNPLMKKISPNAPCPCGSRQKYKKCCLIYHKGKNPKTALLLMRSRYSAYAVGNSSYIVKTTHPNNANYTTNIIAWKANIEVFCRDTEFLGLEIIETIETEGESFVTFRAKLSSGDMVERSRFLEIGNQWLYESGNFIE